MRRNQPTEGVLARLALTAAVAFLLAACAGGGESGIAPPVPTFGDPQAAEDAPAQDEAQDEEAPGIGYPTVAAARQALEERGDVEVSEEDGWTLVEEPDGTLWNFTPSDHPAHPTVVKREVVERPGKDDIDMHGRCEGPRSACQELIRKFEYQNAQLSQSPMRLHQGPTGAAADLPPIGGLMR